MSSALRSSQPNVTVFGADWCEDTHRSRRLLRRLGVTHLYRNVDEDLDALDQATRLGDGVRRTPVIEVDDISLIEPSNEALTSALVRTRVLTRDEALDRLSIQNVGDLERVVRVGGGLMLYATTRREAGALRVPLGLFGVALMLTGVAGWCPVYNARRVSSLGGPGDRPSEAERAAWLRPSRPAAE
jgi:mycoredoxin